MTLNRGEVKRYVATIVIVGAITGPLLFWSWMQGLDVAVIANDWLIILPVWVIRFFLHKYWVFKNNLPRYIRQPSIYAAMVVTTFGALSYLQLALMTYLGVSKWWAAGIAGFTIGCVRFVLFRWVFRK